MVRVSVVVPTHDRTELLMTRCLPSVIAQTFTDWECLVVGDGTEPETAQAMADLRQRDGRFRFWNLPPAPLPQDPASRWAVAGVNAIAHGLDRAVGEWVSILCDDDAYEPRALEWLVAAADRYGGDFIFGQSLTPSGKLYGGLPARPLDIPQGSYILRAELGYRPDPTTGRPWDGEFLGRVLTGGHGVVFVPRIVHAFFPSSESFAMSRAWQGW